MVGNLVGYSDARQVGKLAAYWAAMTAGNWVDLWVACLVVPSVVSKVATKDDCLAGNSAV